MDSLFFRTEDLRSEDIDRLFVETSADRQIIESLKDRSPSILVGSRGVGKSFLLKVAFNELEGDFERSRVLPVYLTFMRGSLLQTQSEEVFRAWMLSKISKGVIRRLKKVGAIGEPLQPYRSGDAAKDETKLDKFIARAETAWRDNANESVDASDVPSVDDFRDAFEDLSEEYNLNRIVLLIDEAAHIFAPRQQRQFFTLFRDLRAPYLTCNAAVYPGVTSYGSSFQASHDATMLEIDRDVQSADYLSNMTDIVLKQADEPLTRAIARNRKNFKALAYAASGNPRLLLKSVQSARKMNSTQVTEVLREFYRTTMWKDHSDLADKYKGHSGLVDWGRTFLEEWVIPLVGEKNASYIAGHKSTSAYFWVHRHASEKVKSALRILCYTGLISEHETGLRATRSEIGTRYRINLGALVAQMGNPTADLMHSIAFNLTPKRMTEFGLDSEAFSSIDSMVIDENALENFSLAEQMKKSSNGLDLTAWQKEKLQELGLNTIKDTYSADLEIFKKAHYVGDIRAKQMKSAAEAAVLEYLSG